MPVETVQNSLVGQWSWKQEFRHRICQWQV